MKYIKVENNIVVQVQPNYEQGFIEVEDRVVCGMELKDNILSTPKILITDEEINAELDKQIEELERKGFRALREAFLNPSDIVARARVQQTEDDIASKRAQRK